MPWAPLTDGDETRRWLERFHAMADGVLRRIEVHYRSSTGPARALVELSVRDTAGPDAWTNVLLEVRGLVEHALAEGGARGSYQILSNGLHVARAGGLVIVELGHFADPPASLSEVRRSPCYLAGAELFWQLAPYTDSPS